MRLESPPELIEGIKPATRKRLDALHRDIKNLTEAEADHERAVRELKSASGLPSTADRDRLQDQQFELLQRRLELCDRAVEFSQAVVEETRQLESLEAAKKPGILDAIADKLRTVGYDFYRSDIYWRDRAQRFQHIEALLACHPLIAEHERLRNDIGNIQRQWSDYSGGVFQDRERLAKTVNKIREDALAAV